LKKNSENNSLCQSEEVEVRDTRNFKSLGTTDRFYYSVKLGFWVKVNC